MKMSIEKDATWRQRKGWHFEQTALTYLEQHGLALLARNFCCKAGEIDLVMRDGDFVVFVEVRFRSKLTYGKPHETVDWRKQAKIRRAAQYFLLTRNEYCHLPCRFDVLALWPDSSGKIACHWIQSAFH